MIFANDEISFIDAYHRWGVRLKDFLNKTELDWDSQGLKEFIKILEMSAINPVLRTDCSSAIFVSNKIFNYVQEDIYTVDVLNTEFTASWVEDHGRYAFENFPQFPDGISEVENHILCVPRAQGLLFLYLNLDSGTIDCRGYDLVRRDILKNIDLEEGSAIDFMLSENKHIPVKEILEKPEDYLRVLRYRDAMEFGIPIYMLHSPSPFQKFNGCSINIRLADLEVLFEREYPLEESKIMASIKDEKEAEKNSLAHMKKNPKTVLRKDDFVKLFCSQLGKRSALRVWSTVVMEFPHLSKSGPKRNDFPFVQ
jgi:hypothetical protein